MKLSACVGRGGLGQAQDNANKFLIIFIVSVFFVF